jgi:hypothetical protein
LDHFLLFNKSISIFVLLIVNIFGKVEHEYTRTHCTVGGEGALLPLEGIALEASPQSQRAEEGVKGVVQIGHLLGLPLRLGLV